MKETTCEEKGFNSDIFWKDGTYKVKGGIYYRAFDLNKFLRKLELENDMNVVGLKFDGYNLEVLIEDGSSEH